MPDFGTLPSQKTGLADLLSVPFLMPHFYIFLILFFAHCRIQVVQIMHQLQKLAHIVLSKPGEDLIPDLIIFLFGLFRGGFSFRSSADRHLTAILRVNLTSDIFLLFKCI